MKWAHLLVVYSLILLLFPFSVISVGFRAPGNRVFLFEPGKTITLNYQVFGAERIEVGVEGELTEYATVLDPAPNTSARDITLQITYPENLPSGSYTTFLYGLELPRPGGTVAGVAKIRSRTITKVLNPEKEVFFRLETQDGNVDASVNLSLLVTSFTTQQIDSIRGVIDVYDAEGKKVDSQLTETKTLASDTAETLTAVFTTNGWLQGMYTANATLFWDGQTNQTGNGSFRIGTLDVDLVSYTKNFSMDTINKVDLVVESEWNGIIKDVYAMITLGNDTFKTPNVDMKKFQQATLTGYWDTRGYPKGELQGEAEIFYASTSKVFPLTVFIDKPKGVDAEVPSEGLSMLTILIIVLAVLFLANIIYFVLHKKKHQAS